MRGANKVPINGSGEMANVMSKLLEIADVAAKAQGKDLKNIITRCREAAQYSGGFDDGRR
jgi:hypothetical protein